MRGLIDMAPLPDLGSDLAISDTGGADLPSALPLLRPEISVRRSGHHASRPDDAREATGWFAKLFSGNCDPYHRRVVANNDFATCRDKPMPIA